MTSPKDLSAAPSPQGMSPWAPYLAGAAPARRLSRSLLQGAQVGVMGLGIAGGAMAELLQEMGCVLTLADANEGARAGLAKRFPNATLALGSQDADTFAGCAFVALSPGVHPNKAAIVAAVQRGAFVFGELELLAMRQGTAPIFAITGTNGKSTTTALSGALAQACALPAFVGGNLGEPIAGWLAGPQRAQSAVLELSSYQIDGAHAFASDVAAVLNLAPDHLPRYGDFATYCRSKARLLQLQHATGIAVLNADDPQVRALASCCKGQLLWFGRSAEGLPGPGLWWRGAAVVAVHPEQTPVPLTLAEGAWAHPVLVGEHNKQNILAALVGTLALLQRAGVKPSPAALRRGFAAFTGLPHRLAPVASRGEVRWLDDSKATNDASVATAVRAMQGPYVLLLGGSDDGSVLPLTHQALRACPPRTVLCFGAVGARLAAEVAPLLEEVGAGAAYVGTLEQACARAQKMARAGDTVLLSPGCKSFDAFTDYRHRGRAFAAWVQANVG